MRKVDYVYVWADGVYTNVRLPDADGAADRLCLLVIVGVRPTVPRSWSRSPTATARTPESWLRQRVTKGPGCRAAGIAMAFKLMEAAQARWRRLNGPELVALVRAGATFIDGQLQERDKEEQQDEMSVEECAA